MRVREYVYVSDTKVDMLFEQIPRPWAKRMAGELKISLKLVSLSLREAPTTQTRYSKLAVVESFVRRELAVGSVDDPELYVSGTLPMRWGPYGEEHGMVFFAGASSETVVGLGGSLRHVIGTSLPGTRHMYSAAPVLVKTLTRAGQLTDAGPAGRVDLKHGGLSASDAMWPGAIVEAAKQLSPPTQRLEFLARCIRRADYPVAGRTGVLIGSPIFVANA
jgi:uncharacterized protein DUF7019